MYFNYKFLIVCVLGGKGIYAQKCGYLLRPKEGFRFPGVVLLDACEPPHIRTEYLNC